MRPLFSPIGSRALGPVFASTWRLSNAHRLEVATEVHTGQMRCEWPKELGCSQVDGGLARQRDNRGHDLRRGLVLASFRFAASHVAPPAGPRADFLGWF